MTDAVPPPKRGRRAVRRPVTWEVGKRKYVKSIAALVCRRAREAATYGKYQKNENKE